MDRALVLSNGPCSEENNKSTSYLLLCLSLNFCNETSEPELHWVLKPGILGFGHARVPKERAEGQEEKTVGKTCQGIPFIACQKIY